MIEMAYLDYHNIRDWKLNMNESMLMAVFSEMEKYSPNQIFQDANTYHVLSRRNILNELPILESTSCIKRGILGLEKKGVIKSISLPDIDYTHTAYALTEKGQRWNELLNGESK